MFDRDRSDFRRWYGLAGVVGLLALSLVLLGDQVAAVQGAPPNGPPWRPKAGGEAGAYSLSPTEQGDWDGFGVSWPCVISDTSEYRMWYNGYNPSSPGYGWQIGGAGSPDGTTWAKHPGNPVLGVGAPGEWDDMYRGQMACMNDGGTYKMWFAGGSSGPWKTGYATSSDGIAWNVYAGNPVLPSGGPGSWDEVEADGPSVLKDGGTYKMWYFGCSAGYSTCSIGYATSPDGIAWTKYAGNPVLTGTAGQWDENYVSWPRVIKNGSTYEMWYHDGQIGRATSPDGINWTKYPGNPVLSLGWDGAGVSAAWVLLEGSTYKMWVRSGTGASEGIGYATSSDGIAWTMYGGNPVLTAGDPGLLAEVNYDHDWVQVRTLPGTTVAITVADGSGVKATTSGQTDEWGGFGTWDADWDPEHPDIMPGDIVSATGEGLTTKVDPVGTIDAAVDPEADTVAGTVHAPWFAPQTLDVRCEVWVEGGPRIDVPGVAADGGSFTCDYGAIGWDLEAWQEVAARYLEPDGDSVIGMPPRLQPSITADYYDDWVNGRYEAGHTAWITVTESDHSTVKATAEVVSQVYPEWNNWTGFATQGEDWLPMYVDIQPGDWVDVLMDNGYGSLVKVGTIDGESDVDTDVVSGTIHADWLAPGRVRVNCEIHEDEGPWIEVEDVDPDGGSFLCDFAGEWDILPGQNVAVNYVELDTDRVQTHVIEPAPDMSVEKWTQGSDQVAPGGPIVYTIRYRNEGDVIADPVVLTDTLHPQTSYGSDSSGVTPSLGVNKVVWTLGPVQPGEEVEFQLVLYNSAASGATLPNEVDIWTENDPNPDNNHADAEVHVVDEVGNPYVNKHADPNRPVAGGTYLYEIDCGNDGPVAAGPVVLTDNLPDDTHVVDWFSENGYGLWTETSSNGQLVLEAPAIPGHWGDRIVLRLAVESGVPYGTWLTNTVELDLPVGSAQHEHTDVRVEGPYWDSYVGKQFGWGELVPGGQVQYNVHVRNFGNQPAQTWLTDTLPAGTQFAESQSWDGQTWAEFPPYYVDDQKVVWDMGQMLPGAWMNLDIRLDIDSGVQSGDELVNCVELGIDGEDSNPEDNEDCVADPVRGTGPNLRVYKEHEWQDDNQRLRYQIHVENIGTELLENVWFTDTYPVDTTFHDDWGVDHGPHIELDSHHELNRQLIFWAERFEPGETANIRVKVDVDNAGQPLRYYTNIVEVETPPGDTNPADNYFEDEAFSGGEVEYVDFDVYRDWFWGCAYDTPITVTTTSEQLVIEGGECWDEPFPAPFLPGDIVTIKAGAGALPVVIEIPDPFTAYVSGENDEVYGQIDHLDHEMVQVDLWDMPSRWVQTDGNGNYIATYGDIPRGTEGDVGYQTEIDYAQVMFHRRMDRLDLILGINYDHDWVEGEYEAGHTVWITVAHGGGSESYQELTTAPILDWDNQSGFQTQWDDWVPGPGVDIAPGDWVYGSVDTGHTSAVRIGRVTGAISTLADRIRGTVDATWIGEEVDIGCHPWLDSGNPPSKHDTVFPDGVDTYYCSWNPDTEWDVQVEQDLAVTYDTPEGDRVYAVFRVTAQVYLPVVLKNH